MGQLRGDEMPEVRKDEKSKRFHKERAMLEVARKRLRESRATVLLGFEVESVEEGRAILRMNSEAHHKQIHGVVHGGILAAMADTAGAIAAYSVVPNGMELATIEQIGRASCRGK